MLLFSVALGEASGALFRSAGRFGVHIADARHQLAARHAGVGREANAEALHLGDGGEGQIGQLVVEVRQRDGIRAFAQNPAHGLERDFVKVLYAQVNLGHFKVVAAAQGDGEAGVDVIGGLGVLQTHGLVVHFQGVTVDIVFRVSVNVLIADAGIDDPVKLNVGDHRRARKGAEHRDGGKSFFFMNYSPSNFDSSGAPAPKERGCGAEGPHFAGPRRTALDGTTNPTAAS